MICEICGELCEETRDWVDPTEFYWQCPNCDSTYNKFDYKEPKDVE